MRETGTEIWFSEPLGILSASRTTLKVYHTPEMQQIVADVRCCWGPEKAPRLSEAAGDRRFVSRSTQSVCQRFGDRRFVLHYQNPRHVRGSTTL